jgi:hypothetical protein
MGSTASNKERLVLINAFHLAFSTCTNHFWTAPAALMQLEALFEIPSMA